MSDSDRGQVAEDAAETYERFFVPALFGQWPPQVVAHAGTEPGQRVLDVGCGTGVLARAVSHIVGADGRVVGLDPNLGMLEVARRSPEPIEWVPGMAEDLPFADGEFDHVVSQFAAMFFDDRHRAVEEMARVTAPGGTVTVVTWAEIDSAPGYAAMASLLDELFGTAVARSLAAPFTIGRVEDLQKLLAPALSDVRVSLVPGEARFESIDAWVHTEIRGWTLADAIDNEQYGVLLAEARTRLLVFADSTGAVTFPITALVGSGRRSGVLSSQPWTTAR